MFTRVVVFASPQEVADTVAHKFLERVVDLLGSRDEVQVCLTGGGTADLVYERFADLAAEAKLDLGRLHLWWGDERFVAATDPDRNSQVGTHSPHPVCTNPYDGSTRWACRSTRLRVRVCG